MAEAEKSSVDKLPPHSIEAERELIGALFLDNQVLNDVVGKLKKGYFFYRTAHGLIFDAMVALANEGKEFSWITVATWLEKKGQLQDAGGMDYLKECTEFAPTSAGAVHAAEIIRDRFILRQVISTASDVRAQAFDPTAEAEHLIETFEQKVFELGNQRFHAESKTIVELLNEFQIQLEAFKKLRLSNDAVVGLPSGYKDLDRISTGFHPGQLLIMAARPGHGKTSLALNIAAKMAIAAPDRADRRPGGGDGGVAFFSLEMTGVELISRVVCAEAGVSLKDVRQGNIDNLEARALEEANDRLMLAPLFIDDSFTITMTEIRAKARRLKQKHNIEMVVVDYLQLIGGETGKDRHEFIGQITRGLKALARELEIPVLALAQLNRKIEDRRGSAQRPQLSDLRESGSIEQDADMVMFIQRDRMLDAAVLAQAQEDARMIADPREREEFLNVEPATLIVAKNRSGPVDDVPLSFRKSCTRFEAAMDAARHHFSTN